MPDDIARDETETESLNGQMAEDGFFADEARSKAVLDRVATLQDALQAKYARWDELESMASG